MAIKTCCECGTQFKTISPKFCSRKCFHVNYGKNHRKENSPRWKGDDTGYHGVHTWLRKNYGVIGICENCTKTSKLHWAKKKDKEYERKRENFLHLCASCHKRYDITDSVRANMSRAKKGMASNMKGKHHTKETKDKIRAGLKKYFHSL